MNAPLAASFAELTEALEEVAGGKARVLARLYREGYPVPDGFVVFPSAFDGVELSSQGRARVIGCLGNLDTYVINESLAEDTLWVNTALLVGAIS